MPLLHSRPLRRPTGTLQLDEECSCVARLERSGAVAVLAVFALLIAPGGALAAWMQVATAPARTPAAPDGEWPRRYAAPDGASSRHLRTADRQLGKPEAADAPRGGVAHAEGERPCRSSARSSPRRDTRVSVEERLVDFSSFSIIQSNFPGATREQAGAAVAAIKASMPVRERVIALDRVLAYHRREQIRPKNVDGVKADPPVVFFSTRPAVIVNIDGNRDLESDPGQRSPLRGQHQLGPVRASAVEDLLPAARRRVDEGDQRVRAVGGRQARCPRASAKLPADDNWKEVRAALPGRTLAASALPRVFVSTAPAELILLRGEPQYEPVPGHDACCGSAIRTPTCSGSDRAGPVYYLVAGRWFSAPGFDGPWTFATPTLPADFAKIPLEHERSRVLASVPGTVQAAEAVLLAQVPQTARVSKKMVRAPEVAYQGEPRVPADRARPRSPAPRTPTRTSSRSATCITCASRASGSWPARRPGRGK